MMNKRIEWVDVAKAIGILLVVYGHVILGVHDAGVWGNTFSYRLQHSVIYATHMPLFFFLSGIFAVKWVQRVAKTAIWQKAKTLLIPYFVWGIVQAVVMQVFSKSTNNGQGLGNAVQLPFMPYAQFWFLYDLFWIFMVYYLFLHVFKLSTKWYIGFAAVMFLISPFMGVWEFWRIFYYMIFFALGTLVLNHSDLLDKVNIWLNLILVVILHLIYFFVSMPTALHNAFSFFVAMSGVVLLINLSKHIKSSAIDYVGRNSMAIFLLHIIFTAGTRIVFTKLGLDNLYIQLIAGLFMGMLAPLVVLEITRKMKINQYLF
ncbi:acyltransferase [Fructobacillus tropaeoli]